MTRIITLVASLFLAWPVLADGINNPNPSGIVINQTPVQNGTNGECLYINSTNQVGEQSCGGSVTSITVGTTTVANGTTGNIEYNNGGVLGEKGVTGTGSVVLVTSPTLVTPALGVAVGTSFNGLTITTTTGSLTIANSKTLTDTSGVGANLLLGATGGGFAAYGGASCTNQFLNALSAAGVGTCASVVNADLTAGSFTNITGVGALAAGSLASGFTTVAVAQGGTGQSSALTQYGLIYATTTTAMASTAAGTSSGVLQGNAAGAPTWVTTLSSTIQGNITTTGTLSAGTAGTGFVIGGVTMTLGSDGTGDTYYRNSSGVLTRLAIGSTGNVLTVAAGLPSWAAPAAAAAGSLTGATLASGVTASSLTSVGTLTGLTMGGNIAMGGNAITGGGAITGTSFNGSTNAILNAASGSPVILQINGGTATGLIFNPASSGFYPNTSNNTTLGQASQLWLAVYSSGYYAGATKGVTCSGALTVVSSITITDGIITAATGTGGTCS